LFLPLLWVVNDNGKTAVVCLPRLVEVGTGFWDDNDDIDDGCFSVFCFQTMPKTKSDTIISSFRPENVEKKSLSLSFPLQKSSVVSDFVGRRHQVEGGKKG